MSTINLEFFSFDLLGRRRIKKVGLPTHQQISWNNNSNNFNDSIYPYLHRINRWLNATYIYTFSVGYLLKSHFSMLTNSGHFWWYWMPRYILVQANLNIILNCPDVLRAVGLNYLYKPEISQDKPQSMWLWSSDRVSICSKMSVLHVVFDIERYRCFSRIPVNIK